MAYYVRFPMYRLVYINVYIFIFISMNVYEYMALYNIGTLQYGGI